VYEFWQGSNGYGLVEMFEREQASRDPRFVAYHLALARADDQTKVYEKRDNGQGLLLISHDFVNYKGNLAATRAAESDWDPNFMYHEGMERRSVDMTQRSWPWEPEFHEPESCIDWGQIEELVRSHV